MVPLPYTSPSCAAGAEWLRLHCPFFGPLLWREPTKPNDSVRLTLPWMPAYRPVPRTTGTGADAETDAEQVALSKVGVVEFNLSLMAVRSKVTVPFLSFAVANRLPPPPRTFRVTP